MSVVSAGKLLSFPAAGPWGRAGNAVLDLAMPPLGLAATAALLWAAGPGPWRFVDMFPATFAVVCLLFLVSGPFWASLCAALATAGGMAALYYVPWPAEGLLLLGHMTLLWVLFFLLIRLDLDRESALNRWSDRLDRLRLEETRRNAEAESRREEAQSAQERIAAYNRLRFFTDDLIGAYDREELSRRSRAGLETLFPRARAEITLFPASNQPSPEDDWGRTALKPMGARLYPSRGIRLPSLSPGRYMFLPLRVGGSAIGWLSAERGADDRPFLAQDLRLAAIAGDLVSMAIGNAERYSHIEALAISDGLTGLYTRGYLDERLEEEFAKARHQGRPFSLLILDIDHFKKVNDDHGHRLGDEVLRWLARLAGGQSRDTDFLARYGGEEFVMLLPNTALPDAALFARRLGRAVAETAFRWDRLSLKVTVSIGVAALDGEVRDGTEMLRRADQALYRAKAEGRNRVCAHE